MIQYLRASLPADQVEATIKALEKSKRQLRNKSKPQAPVVPPSPTGRTPAELGRSYRLGGAVGELAREHRQFESSVQMLGSRAMSRDAPESGLLESDRLKPKPCGFSRSKWSLISDSKLILAIERVLRPSRSTDFAMELKTLKVVREGDEVLQASYCTFAERILAKVAEAEDAGRPVKGVVVKAAFKTAIEKEVALKTWFVESRWRGVNHAHARLLRKLRKARIWEAISKTVLKAKHSTQVPDQQADSAHDDAQSPRNFRRAPRRRENNTCAGRGVVRNKAGGMGRPRGRARSSPNNSRARFNGTNYKYVVWNAVLLHPKKK